MNDKIPEDIDNFEIKSRYVAKLGMILLKLKPELASDLQQKYVDNELENPYYEEMVALQRTIKEVLLTCADIKSVQWLSEPLKEHFEPFEHYLFDHETKFIQQSSSFLFFEGFIPKSERKYTFDVRYIQNVIENFKVLYNGHAFLAYSKIDDNESDIMFGQEAREFLKSNLNSEKWDVISVPPCPLHPDIYINFIDSTELTPPIFDEYKIDFFFPIKMEEDILNLFKYILFEYSIELERFMSAATLESKSEQLSWQIEDLFDDIVNNFKNVYTSNKVIFLNKWKDIRIIRNLIFELRLLLNDYSNTCFKFHKERNTIADNDYFSLIGESLHPYFISYLIYQPIPLAEVKETIQYIEQEITSRYFNYYTVLAAILGAIIGAAISKLF